MKKLLLLPFLLFNVCVFAQSHLLLSEVGVTPNANEFIEIYNPTSSPVTLTNYYLSDINDYYKLPSNSYTPNASDFIVRFPADSVIGPGEVIVVALSGTEFQSLYLYDPDYDIRNPLPLTAHMLPVSNGASSGITNAGECVILFYWDGASDLVQDVDMINTGSPTVANSIVPKTGFAQDGPDADANTSTYLNDANTIPAVMGVIPPLKSIKRILLEDINETHGGGNGMTGDDETTENTLVTWGDTAAATTPGVVDIVLGVGSILNPDADFSVYPNPASQYSSFTIQLNVEFRMQNVELKMYDVTGREVYSAEIAHRNSCIVNQVFSPGIYFIKVTGGGEKRFTQKLIIQ